MHALFFHTTSSKDRMSLLEVVLKLLRINKKKKHFNIRLLVTKTGYMHLPHEDSLNIRKVMNYFLTRPVRIQV